MNPVYLFSSSPVIDYLVSFNLTDEIRGEPVDYADLDGDCSKVLFTEGTTSDDDSSKDGLYSESSQEIVKKSQDFSEFSDNEFDGIETKPSECAVSVLNNTPQKYYSISENEKGKLVLLATPGFHEEVERRKREHCSTAYVIKDIQSERRYVGVSCKIDRRVRQHIRAAAAYSSSESVAQVKGKRKGGRLYPQMGARPADFKVGLLPVKSLKEVEPSDPNHVMFSDVNALERWYIEQKKGYTQGYNSNKGGGGPNIINSRTSVKKTNKINSVGSKRRAST